MRLVLWLLLCNATDQHTTKYILICKDFYIYLTSLWHVLNVIHFRVVCLQILSINRYVLNDLTYECIFTILPLPMWLDSNPWPWAPCLRRQPVNHLIFILWLMRLTPTLHWNDIGWEFSPWRANEQNVLKLMSMLLTLFSLKLILKHDKLDCLYNLCETGVILTTLDFLRNLKWVQ